MILKKYKIDDRFETNNYLLIDEKGHEAVLIDCTGNFVEIKKELDKYSAKLKYILLTHGHFDHIFGCLEFKDKLNPTIVIHKDDKIMVDNVDIQCNLFGIPVFKMPKVDAVIDENSKLEFGAYDIDVIHTSGHTPGGVCYMIDNKLFSGDTLFYENVGRCDLAGGNFNEIVHNISNKLYTLPKDTMVYTGHGENTTIGHEIENNFYVNKNSII